MLKKVSLTVMNVVIVTPPTNTQSTHEISNRNSPQAISPPTPSQFRVSSIVSNEGDLMPERSEANGGDDVVE